jgi:hypothetical protein
MTASKPNLRVLAGGNGIADWLATGGPALDGTPVLVVVPNETAATLRAGDERDLCSPGFVSGVVQALATAGIRQAGGPGVQALHRRALSLGRAVLDIGEVLRDVVKDLEPRPGAVVGFQLLTNAAAAISEIVESCAGDVCGVDPVEQARAVLAAAGWWSGMFPSRIGKPPHNWVNHSGDRFAWVGEGAVVLDGEPNPPDVLRAFATLAEESQP